MFKRIISAILCSFILAGAVFNIPSYAITNNKNIKTELTENNTFECEETHNTCNSGIRTDIADNEKDSYEHSLIRNLGRAVSSVNHCGPNLTWTVKDGVLTISGTGEMWDYEYWREYDSDWHESFYYCNSPWYYRSFTTIVLCEGVTSIGDNAFREGSYTNIYVPSTLKKVDSGAFVNCSTGSNVYISDIKSWCEREYDLPNVKKLYFNEQLITDLVIPDSVTKIVGFAFSGCNNIKTVKIPNSVKEIGAYAFSSCNFSSVIIPASVINLSEDSFSGCSSLTTIAVNVNNPNYAAVNGVLYNKDKTILYLYPRKRTNVVFSVPDTVKTIANAFMYCTYLKSVTIPDSVTEIGDNAFYNCTSLTNLSIPSSVIVIGKSAFYNCTSLIKINIPSSVNEVGDSAFAYCNALTKIDIPSSITRIGEAVFRNCTSLTSITIPSTLTEIGKNAFYNCRYLNSIILSEAVASIGEDAFYGCSGLIITCDILSYTASYATDNSIKFRYPGDSTVYIAAGLCNDNVLWNLSDGFLLTVLGTGAMRDYTSSSPAPWYTIRSKINSIIISDGIINIGAYAFSDCDSVKTVTIAESVTTVGANAFSDCDSVTEFLIGDHISYIGECAFSLCDSLTNFCVGDNNKYFVCVDGILFNRKLDTLIQYPIGRSDTYFEIPGYITEIGSYAFCECDTLNEVFVSDSVTTVGKDAFKDCSKIKGVYITDIAAWCEINFDNAASNPLYYSKTLYLDNVLVIDLVIPASVLSIGNHSFYNCTSIKSVTFDSLIESIGESAFSGCTNLKSVYIDDLTMWCGIGFANSSSNPLCNAVDFYINGTSKTGIVIPDTVTQIGDYAFYDCEFITRVSISNSVKSIGKYAFANCDGIEYVTLGNSLEKIDNGAFRYCKKMDYLTIPESVTDIGEDAFYSCSNLYYITLGNNITHIGKDAFTYTDKYETVLDDEDVLSIGPYLLAIDGTTVYTEEFYIGSNIKLIADGAVDGYMWIHIPSSVKYIGYDAFSKTEISRLYITDVTAWCNINFSNEKSNPLYFADGLYLNDVKIKDIKVPQGTSRINKYAFYSSILSSITIPESVTYIDENAFKSNTSIIIRCYEDSYAHHYAEANNISYELLCKHVYTKYENDNNATCTSDGTKTAFCDNNCGQKDTVVVKGSMIPHLFDEYIYNDDATCTYDGTKTAYCKYDCGASDTVTDEGSMLPHKYDIYTYNDDASCMQDGTKTSYCEYGCGVNDTVTIEGSILPHKYEVYSYNNDASCMEDGTMTLCCSFGCGNMMISKAEGTRLEHVFTEYKYNNDATLYADGTQTSFCDYGCGTTDTKIAENTKLQHAYTDYRFNNDASCFNDGTMSAYCDCGCGSVDTRTAEGTRLNHSFINYVYNGDATCYSDGTESALCENKCGASATRIAVGTMIEDHLYTEWYIVLEPTYEADGRAERTCTVCGKIEHKVLAAKAPIKLTFKDVSNNAWYTSSVQFVIQKGYMNGMSDTIFSPNSNITREQFVLILANIAEVDTDEYKSISSGFADVKTGQWYSGAVSWAVKEGYVSGISAVKFGRGQSIQRAALARILYNYSSRNGIDTTGRADISCFGDSSEFDKAGNAWMKEPVQWAVESGMISGMNINGKTCVNPKGTATRAQTARILMKFDDLKNKK